MWYEKKRRNMSEPLLSIIIANYNNGLYIRDCVASILSQTYQNLELIIVDDHSTDSSLEIIKEYEKKYPEKIKSLFRETHCGVSQNRHRAALISTGLYLTTLDSDDYYYDSRKLEKEMDLLLHYREKNGREIVSFSNIVLVKADKTLICFWGNPETIREGNVLAPIMGRTCLIPRDFVMSREAYFKVGGYDGQIDLYEDWDIKIRLAAQYSFFYTGINGTAYRRHGTGLSSANMATHEKWLSLVFEKNIHLADPENQPLIRQKFEEYLDSAIRKVKIPAA
jgi:glycosyltransferase involved in cell wall biosynthesis